MRFFAYITLFLLVPALKAQAGGERTDRQKYIDQWSRVAQQQMLEHGIPASITLAQGILESGNGNSMLSKQANNHFGIKCHGWDGPGVYKDDDQKNECFRKYRSAEESYEDHSAFLKKSRYASLYELEVTDYKSWAKGLKKAGYATDPKYAQRLIKIIEENDLHVFDKVSSKELLATRPAAEPRFNERGRANTNTSEVIDLTESRSVLHHPNGIRFIKARDGENVEAVARSLDMAPWQIKRYNDLSSSYTFKGGETIFLQPKRNKAKADYHLALEGETIRLISQRHGVKMSRLEQYNSLSADTPLNKGQKVLLRPPAR